MTTRNITEREYDWRTETRVKVFKSGQVYEVLYFVKGQTPSVRELMKRYPDCTMEIR